VKAALGALLLPLLSACFVYRPASPAELRPGDVTAVELSESGAVTLAPDLGPRASRLDGRVVASGDSALTLAVNTIVRRSLEPESWSGTVVRVPTTAAAQWRVRRFDAPRSALATAGILAAMVTTRLVAREAGLGRGGTGGSSNGR